MGSHMREQWVAMNGKQSIQLKFSDVETQTGYFGGIQNQGQ